MKKRMHDSTKEYSVADLRRMLHDHMHERVISDRPFPSRDSDAIVNAMLVLDAIAIAGQALPPGAAASRPKTSPPASERKRQSDKILFLERAVAHHAMDANRFQTLVGLASAVIEAARRLPGLYTVQVDGRPGFTSQAAADLCNALNKYDAVRTGTTPRVNNVPGGHSSKQSSCRGTKKRRR